MFRVFCLLFLASSSWCLETVSEDEDFRKFNMGLDTEGLIEFHMNVFWEHAATERCPANFKPSPSIYPHTRHPCETGIICQGFVISEWWSLTAAHCIK